MGVSRYLRDHRAPADTLTLREWEAIRLINRGLKNKEIAAEMGTTECVIKNLVKTIFDKLGFGVRVEVALWFERYKDMRPGAGLINGKFENSFEGNFEGSLAGEGKEEK